MKERKRIKDVLMEYASANSYQMGLTEAVSQIKAEITQELQKLKIKAVSTWGYGLHAGIDKSIEAIERME